MRSTTLGSFLSTVNNYCRAVLVSYVDSGSNRDRRSQISSRSDSTVAFRVNWSHPAATRRSRRQSPARGAYYSV